MYTDERLATLAGTTLDRIRLMTGLGILTPGDDGYRPPDIQRVRIAEALDRAGIELGQIGEMIRDGAYSTGWADLLFPEPVPMSDLTFAEACDQLDLPEAFAQRLFTVSYQLPAPAPDERLREDELELLRISAQFFPLIGRDEDAGIASARYFGDNVRRLSESQMRFFRTQFEEPMIASGMSQREVMDLVTAVGAPIVPLGFRVVELLHRRHLEHFEIEDIVTNTEIAMHQAGLKQRQDAHPPAIAFCDLTGSTQLTEQLGDEGAARLADRLADAVTTIAAKHEGQVVKLLGDGAMLRFRGPAGAARAGLELVHEAPGAELPPLRMGVHVGPVVFRDGDYYGRTVIVAARVTDLIGPSQVVLTGDAASQASSGDLAFDDMGVAELKGVSDPVPLYRARRLA